MSRCTLVIVPSLLVAIWPFSSANAQFAFVARSRYIVVESASGPSTSLGLPMIDLSRSTDHVLNPDGTLDVTFSGIEAVPFKSPEIEASFAWEPFSAHFGPRILTGEYLEPQILTLTGRWMIRDKLTGNSQSGRTVVQVRHPEVTTDPFWYGFSNRASGWYQGFTEVTELFDTTLTTIDGPRRYRAHLDSTSDVIILDQSAPPSRAYCDVDAGVKGFDIVTDYPELPESDRKRCRERYGFSVVGDVSQPSDKHFNSSDLVKVFTAGEYEDDIDKNSNWYTGDWTGDREFDSADLVLAFQEGHYERRAITNVPEPSSMLLLFGLLTIVSSHVRATSQAASQ